MTSLMSIVGANDLFGGLYSERNEEEDRKIEVGDCDGLEKYARVFEKYLENIEFDPSYNLDLCSSLANRQIFNDEISTKDIAKYSLAFGRYKRDKIGCLAGIFLNELIYKCEERDVIIKVSHLNYFLDNVGYKNNGKNITVIGDVGNYIGERMVSGIINVGGNAGNYVGWKLGGGKIMVSGDVGYCVGSRINGGIIEINGNAGEEVGEFMDPPGGIINIKGRISGDAGRYSRKGRIYVNGRPLIVDGRKVM